MKIILHIFVVVLVLSGIENKCSAQSSRIKIEYDFDVSFGRRSKDCRGFGICIIPQKVKLIMEKRRAVLTSVGERLCLRVPFVLANDFPEQFAQEDFIMEEDFIFPEEFTRMAGLEEPLELKEGKYVMDRTKDGYLIYLE